MPFQPGTSNRTALRYVAESVFGTTPSNPVFKELRYTGESINFNQASIVSNEIRADRNTGDSIRVDADVSGDINAELSFETFDDMIAAALCSSFPTPPAGTAPGVAAATAGAGTLPAATYYYQVTAIGATGIESLPTAEMSLAAGANTGVNVNWTTAAGATGYKIYGRVTGGSKRLLATVGVVLTYLDNGSITPSGATIPVTNTSSIRNGTSLLSFTIQKHFQDLAVPVFQNFTGCRIGGMNLEFQTGQILTGSFSVMGLTATSGTSQVAGATVVPLGANKAVLNSVTNLTTIQKDGVTLTSSIKSMTLALNNNLRGQKAIGTLGNKGVALGRCEITGNIELYFEDLVEYTSFLNATYFSIGFRVADPNGTDYYDVLMPRVKYESGTIVAGGLDQDLMISGTYRAVYDATEACMIRINKVDA